MGFCSCFGAQITVFISLVLLALPFANETWKQNRYSKKGIVFDEKCLYNILEYRCSYFCYLGSKPRHITCMVGVYQHGRYGRVARFPGTKHVWLVLRKRGNLEWRKPKMMHP